MSWNPQPCPCYYVLSQSCSLCGLKNDPSSCSLPVPLPEGMGVKYSEIYNYVKYMHMKTFDVHVVATYAVSNDKMCQVAKFIDKMISTLKYPQDRIKFTGHTIILIGSADPAFGVKKNGTPHRNTGNLNFTVLDVDMINHMAVDSNGNQFFRAWNIPVHEFAHTIEFKLNLTAKTDQLYPQNDPKYDPNHKREYFPWAAEKWFNSNVFNVTRDKMAPWEYSYLVSVFDPNNTWIPANGV